MKIHYNKVFGYIFVFAGLFNLGVFLLVLSRGDKSGVDQVFLSLMAFFLSYTFFRGRYFEVTDKSLVTYSLLGSRGKAYPYQNKSDISVDGNTIILMQDGKQERLPFSKTMSDGKDWQALIEWIEHGAPLA